MSAPLLRPLTGLAAAALTVALVWAPLVASAEPTETPSPTVSAAATPATTPTASESAEQPGAGTTPSATASESESTASSSPADDATPSDDADSPTPEPSESSTPGRVGSDAIEAPSPSAESSAEQVQAAAEAGAAITLSKSASRASVSKIGQVITYTFVARNTGSIPLDSVAITDELEGIDTGCPASTTLAPGTALTCTATLTITQEWLDFGSIDNSATVFGSYTIPGDPAVTDYVGANASAHVSVDQKPAISLKASVSPSGTAVRGDRLRYTATATNTGNVTLTSARITSSLSSLDLDCDPSARATLAPGETISCSGSYKVTTANARKGRVSNVLTARANGPYDDQRPTDSVTLRTKVTKIASSSDPGLADTGSSDQTLPVGLLGLAAVAAGGWLVRRGVRSAGS